MELKEIISKIISCGILKMTMSKPRKESQYKKITIERAENKYICQQFTEKQAFHTSFPVDAIGEYLYEYCDKFMQFNIRTEDTEHIILVSKKGHVSYKKKANDTLVKVREHNRKKKYIIEEGTVVPPLVDMGIFTKEGKVVRTMYDKFRQINRFIELINDEIKNRNYTSINIIDFGCGKSYLTFILYYYLTEIMGIEANITGLDLKADVIDNCNKAAMRYGYKGLRFEIGDINGYKCKEKPDMVITLHACDTATDYALYNAINWGADLIFSVPCCQHELNGQINSESYSLLTRYGIIKERTSALITDAIRANLLWYKGYNTQVLEFVDMTHTPKNVLIRAVKSQVPEKAREKYLKEVENVMDEFHLSPTLYKLLQE